MAAKKKIAILGGGMSSLSTAYTLTNEPNWQDKYEITVYQLGWRLGGKTTTGRGPHDRIEEHGIHILQGWYETTFKMLRAVYEERREKKLDPNSPLQDLFADGLQRNNTTLLTSFDAKNFNWQNWPLVFPETGELPGDGVPIPWEEQLERAVALLLEFILGSPYQKGLNPVWRFLLRLFFPKHPALKTVSTEPAQAHFARAHAEAKRPHPNFEMKHRAILGHLGHAVRALDTDLHRILGSNSHAEHLLLLANMLYYNLKGVLEDVYDRSTGQLDFPRINKYDYREWLVKHGAPAWVADSVVVRFFYTGTFSNLVNDKGGAIAADTALRFVLTSTGYKGSFVFQFVFGTGDTMVMPVYQVLRARGVRFKFFQKVQQVHWSESGSIERITVAEQVKLKGPDYDPAITLKSGLRCWPAEPRYEQIDDAEAARLKAGHINLESPWAPWKDHATHELTKGTDFDLVVLGIPLGVLPTICDEIIKKRPEWKAMVDNVVTTPTQSAQLWLLKDLKELGFDRAAWGLPQVNGAPNVVVYQNPMYSWLDSSLVLPNESWPPDQQPKFLAYFTGPMPLSAPLAPFTDHQYQEQQNRDLQVALRQYLYDNMGWFFPKAGTLSYPNGLDFNLLADTPGSTPDQRYASQFFRANVSPTDHYTLSVPGSDKFRLNADGSGFDNLLLCGDWINFGINIGYIDGAIQSGQQAAAGVVKKVGAREGVAAG